MTSSNNTTRDITAADEMGLDFILKLVGSPNLGHARYRFLNDARIRSKILLKNADSLTYLIFQLGRQPNNPAPI